MLTVVVWKWKTPDHWKHDDRVFTAEHVNTFVSMFARNYSAPYRIVCITDDPEGVRCETYPLWDDYATLRNPIKGFLSNYRRLKIFSKELAEEFGPRIFSIDLDTVIVGDITELLNRSEPFVGIRLHRPNKGNAPWNIQTSYGGAMYLMDAGAFPEVWDDFDPDVSPALTYEKMYIGSDQAWMSYALGGEHPVWTVADGVMSFRNDPLTHKNRLPRHAKVIHFHGVPKPWDQKAQQYRWVQENWR